MRVATWLAVLGRVESLSECRHDNHCSSETNLNQHCSESLSNDQYKKNHPYIMLVCGNAIQDCQIELTSASISTAHRRLGVRMARLLFCVPVRDVSLTHVWLQDNATAGVRSDLVL